MATQPSLMSIPFAKNGAKATIPVSTTEFGIASLSQGFPTETQLPLDDGGIPPRRIDFNGALNWLSMFAVFQQAGGLFSWSAQVDYDPPSIIYHDGDLWWCLQSNGISTNVIEPGTNESYWILFKRYISSPLDAYPVGTYYISSNPTSPATLFGGTWERVQDRMILAAGSTYVAGSLGGSVTKNISVANMPSHNHSCDTQGGHTHGRGSMNITGTISASVETYVGAITGAFYQIPNYATVGAHEYVVSGMGFDASRSWGGETAWNGWHSHNIGNNGGDTPMDIMPPYIVAYVWRRTA